METIAHLDGQSLHEHQNIFFYDRYQRAKLSQIRISLIVQNIKK